MPLLWWFEAPVDPISFVVNKYLRKNAPGSVYRLLSCVFGQAGQKMQPRSQPLLLHSHYLVVLSCDDVRTDLER